MRPLLVLALAGDWMAAIKREYPHFTVVGEVFDGDPALVSFFQGGRAGFDGIDSGVDTVFDFPSFFPLRRAFAEGKSVRELATMIGHDRLYPNPDALVTFLGLHDVERFMNVRGATTDGLKLAFTFLLTARGSKRPWLTLHNFRRILRAFVGQVVNRVVNLPHKRPPEM